MQGPLLETYLLDVLEKTRLRLLDVTRRNRLLNYREAARDIALADRIPDEVFGQLLAGKSFGFAPVNEKQSEDGQLLCSPDNLQTPYPLRDLERRLRRLQSDYRSALEETGANSLFLAMGFLHWTDVKEGEQVPWRSPLVLLPVRFDKARGTEASAYRLRSEEEALDTNYSLAEKLRKDFGVILPAVSEDTTPEAYWSKVESAVATRAGDGWCVVREMALGLFRFQKQVLWHDLDPHRWPAHSNLTDKPLLRRILLGAREKDTPPAS